MTFFLQGKAQPDAKKDTYGYLGRYGEDSLAYTALDEWTHNRDWTGWGERYDFPPTGCGRNECEGIRILVNFTIGPIGELIPVSVPSSNVCGKKATREMISLLFENLKTMRFPPQYAGKKYYFVFGYLLKC